MDILNEQLGLYSLYNLFLCGKIHSWQLQLCRVFKANNKSKLRLLFEVWLYIGIGIYDMSANFT